MVVKKESRGGNGILDIIEEITPCTEDDNRNVDHHHPRLLQQDSEGDGILEIDDGYINLCDFLIMFIYSCDSFIQGSFTQYNV
ncbi:hypothetical protein ENUP19_0041G0124 [Entamoeba nuttalli]|uniref:Uncharacterized protein n=1 Tax=Entamoeba nuttalli TaxID=412467 RepID=A0ABQ0DA89_9EUKA